MTDDWEVVATSELPAHSPLGASSAERWMNCPGSTALIRQLTLEETDDPDYRRQGTTAHAALAHCLVNGCDTWEIVGMYFEGEEVTVEMADAVQVFLDHVRPLMANAEKVYIEEQIFDPGFHPSFYGTVDWATIVADLLDLRDFKYGEGVVVEVEWNPQIMYYTYGILRKHPEIKRVRLGIVQPRISWHPGGIIRTWEIDADIIVAWAEGTLKPAMVRAENNEGGLKPGDWCRFCPAKLVCPLMVNLFAAASTADPEEVRELTDAQLDREYPLVEAVKHYLRALEAEAYARLNRGRDFGNIKLVHKKANRVWNAGADAIFKSRFGDEAFNPPEFKSPAQMEALGGPAKALVREYSYTPEGGLTVALASDKRVGVKVQSMAEAFPGAIKGD